VWNATQGIAGAAGGDESPGASVFTEDSETPAHGVPLPQLLGYRSVEEFQEMSEPSVQIATDFGDLLISVAGENGARDVCRESRSVSAIVDNSPQWSRARRSACLAFVGRRTQGPLSD
jgi:hypothetical protein